MSGRVLSRSVLLQGEKHPLVIHERKGQKHIHLRVQTDGAIRISVPAGTSSARIEEVIRKKSSWLSERIEKAGTAATLYDPLKRIPVDGEWYSVRYEKETLKGTVRPNDGGKCLSIHSSDGSRAHLQKVLKNYLKNRARKQMAEVLEKWSRTLDIPFCSFSIRDQKSRWGSSSGRGHISLNWRIICTPPAVQDYLIVHELLHQVHHNHSASFWKAVQSKFPRYRECDDWLKQHDFIMGLLR